MKQNFKRLRSNYPKGICGIYDNGGRSADRYTVVFNPYLDTNDSNVYWNYLAMSAAPFHPQGVGLSGCTVNMRPGSGGKGWGNACGKTINWDDLPADCKQAAMNCLEQED